MPTESYWEIQERQRQAVPTNATQVVEDRWVDGREQTAFATLQWADGKAQKVSPGDSVVGTGYDVDTIDATKGVSLRSAEGSGEPDLTIQPRSASATTPDAPKDPLNTASADDSSTRTQPDDYHKQVEDFRRLMEEEFDPPEKIEWRLRGAREYAQKHTYKDVPEEDLGKAARIDFDNTSEGQYWDNWERTGYQMHERETVTGEKRLFLVSEDGEDVIRVDGHVMNPDDLEEYINKTILGL